MNRVSPASRKARRKPLRVSTRRGFTLVELLVSISIVSLLASILVVGLSTLRRQAQIRRCEQQVKKIDELLMTRFNELINKPLPIQFPSMGPSPNPAQISFRRFQIMTCRRELMRMELPIAWPLSSEARLVGEPWFAQSNFYKPWGPLG